MNVVVCCEIHSPMREYKTRRFSFAFPHCLVNLTKDDDSNFTYTLRTIQCVNVEMASTPPSMPCSYQEIVKEGYTGSF